MIKQLVNYVSRILAKQIIDELASMDIDDVAISVLRIQPGDTIILKTKLRLSKLAIEHLKVLIENNFPGHNCLVLEEGLEIEIIHGETGLDVKV